MPTSNHAESSPARKGGKKPVKKCLNGFQEPTVSSWVVRPVQESFDPSSLPLVLWIAQRSACMTTLELPHCSAGSRSFAYLLEKRSPACEHHSAWSHRYPGLHRKTNRKNVKTFDHRNKPNHVFDMNIFSSSGKDR